MRSGISIRGALARLILATAILALMHVGADAQMVDGLPVLMGTTATYTPTTSSSDVNGVWRKVQGDLQQGFKFTSEEWMDLEDLQEFDIDWSAREITVPVDLNEGYGVASIPEGGYEARPSTPNVPDLTLTWIMLNKRFTASLTAMYIDQNNAKAQLKRQLKYQGMKAIDDIGRTFADYFYGFSTGYIAQVDDAGGSLTAATSHTVPVQNGYGLSTITDGTFITNKVKVGDYVALVRSGSLVSNGIGVITAITPGTPSIAVTWNGSCDPNDNDYIVKANSLENTTIAGTDYNRGLVGLLDMMTSTSLHSLSGSTYPNWTAAYADSSGGRFSGQRLERGIDEIANEGGGTLNRVYWSQGVKRDMQALYSAAVRFDDPFSMQMRADVEAKGIKFKSTQRVPPGYVLAFDRRSVRRMTLLDKPGNNIAWRDGEKLENQSGMVFSIDFPVQLVCTNRKNLAYWSGLDTA